MCMKSPPAPKPTIAPPPPPPPAKAPAELEDAVDSNAALRKKKSKGAKGMLGRGKVGAQVAKAASSSTSGLKRG